MVTLTVPNVTNKTNTTGALTPGVSSTKKPGYILNPDAGEGSNAYWQDAAVSALAYKWATSTPEERSNWLGGSWITAQYGTPDVTDGVDANGYVHTSPQTILALSKYVSQYQPGKDSWMDANLPYVAPGANEYIEDPTAVANRVAQMNADRAYDLQLQQEARLAADSAESNAIAREQIAASQANAAAARQAQIEAANISARASMYGADQALKGSMYGTRGQLIGSVYGTNEGNKVQAWGQGGQLAAAMQGLYDARTEHLLNLRANPSDFVERELTSRAMLKPTGYTGPAYSDVPQLQQAINMLLSYNPSMTVEQALALLGGSGGFGGGGAGGGGAGGDAGGAGPGGTSSAGGGSSGWNGGMPGGGGMSFIDRATPEQIAWAQDQGIWMSDLLGTPPEQWGGLATAADRAANDLRLSTEYNWSVMTPEQRQHLLDTGGSAPKASITFDPTKYPASPPAEPAPEMVPRTTTPDVTKMATGGTTSARTFISGDPQLDGGPNPELVEIQNPGPNTRTKVTPMIGNTARGMRFGGDVGMGSSPSPTPQPPARTGFDRQPRMTAPRPATSRFGGSSIGMGGPTTPPGWSPPIGGGRGRYQPGGPTGGGGYQPIGGYIGGPGGTSIVDYKPGYGPGGWQGPGLEPPMTTYPGKIPSENPGGWTPIGQGPGIPIDPYAPYPGGGVGGYPGGPMPFGNDWKTMPYYPPGGIVGYGNDNPSYPVNPNWGGANQGLIAQALKQLMMQQELAKMGSAGVPQFAYGTSRFGGASIDMGGYSEPAPEQSSASYDAGPDALRGYPEPTIQQQQVATASKPPTSATTAAPPPPPAQVTLGSASTPAAVSQPVSGRPGTTPVTPASTTLGSPTAGPNGTITSYPDEIYQNAPSVKFLGGNLPFSDWIKLNTTPIADAFNTMLPDIGGLNLARLAQLKQYDPEAFQTLGSRYKSANRDLPSMIARAMYYAPVGNAFNTSMIRT